MVVYEGPSRVSQVGVRAVVEHVSERNQSRLRPHSFTTKCIRAFLLPLATAAAATTTAVCSITAIVGLEGEVAGGNNRSRP